MHAALVFPHQLFADSPVLAPSRAVFLVEDPLFFGNDPHWPTCLYKQKLVLHRASMKACAGELIAQGHEVHYLETPEGSVMDSVRFLESALPEEISHLHVADPCDFILRKRLHRLARRRAAELTIYDSPQFLTPPEFLRVHCGPGKKPFMARFYAAQRQRLKILVEPPGLAPVGGKWSFDEENRCKLPAGHVPPASPVAEPTDFVREAVSYVARRFPNNPGSLEPFRWPVTRVAASRWLDTFFDERFADFGIYEDAISTRHPIINHAAISCLLNIGLLDPAEVVRRALRKAATARIPMNSLEGFVRQIIGWREFMRGIYLHRGAAIRRGNFWGHETAMPAAFYDGTTGVPPVDRVIRQVLRDGYCHHIERLMVLGCFMLLCRIRPDDVYRWFMELFVDACDWVMVPNVYGMSQFADGGTFTTKPYLCGSNYILKMSDEPKGEWCQVWDGLFWAFIAGRQEFFLHNPRLSIMVKSWHKMPAAKQAAHLERAANFLESLEKPGHGPAPDGGSFQPSLPLDLP